MNILFLFLVQGGFGDFVFGGGWISSARVMDNTNFEGKVWFIFGYGVHEFREKERTRRDVWSRAHNFLLITKK